MREAENIMRTQFSEQHNIILFKSESAYRFMRSQFHVYIHGDYKLQFLTTSFQLCCVCPAWALIYAPLLSNVSVKFVRTV